MWHVDRVVIALREVRPLSDEDRLTIARLHRSMADSLALGYLCAAGHLLERDDLLDATLRVQSWTRWREKLCEVLTESLRYADKDGLVLCVMLAASIYPLGYPGASYAGFKAMHDASDCAAALRNKGVKPPRKLVRMRAIDLIAHQSMWLHPLTGALLRESALTDAQALRAAGFAEQMGLRVSHPQAEEAIRLLDAVLPLRWAIDGESWMVCVKEAKMLRRDSRGNDDSST